MPSMARKDLRRTWLGFLYFLDIDPVFFAAQGEGEKFKSSDGGTGAAAGYRMLGLITLCIQGCSIGTATGSRHCCYCSVAESL